MCFWHSIKLKMFNRAESRAWQGGMWQECSYTIGAISMMFLGQFMWMTFIFLCLFVDFLYSDFSIFGGFWRVFSIFFPGALDGPNYLRRGGAKFLFWPGVLLLLGPALNCSILPPLGARTIWVVDLVPHSLYSICVNGCRYSST